MSEDTNRKTVETMWSALSAMDWDTLKSCLSDDVHYEDVPTEDPGARGPDNVVIRLKIAFDHLTNHEHTIHALVVEGDTAMLDHTEVWTFETGETATNHFATVHHLKDGKIIRWSDFWDVSGFVGQFPAWFLEVMAKHHESEFTG